eukprot:jgi/Mesen1/806/ME000110S_11074
MLCLCDINASDGCTVSLTSVHLPSPPLVQATAQWPTSAPLPSSTRPASKCVPTAQHLTARRLRVPSPRRCAVPPARVRRLPRGALADTTSSALATPAAKGLILCQGFAQLQSSARASKFAPIAIVSRGKSWHALRVRANAARKVSASRRARSNSSAPSCRFPCSVRTSSRRG